MTFNQLFECSHSSFMLRRGQAIISTVLPLSQERFLLDAGLLTTKIIVTDDLTYGNRAVRFDQKVGFRNMTLIGDSRVKKRLMERFFIDLESGDSRIKELAASRFSSLSRDSDPLLIPRRFRQLQAWRELKTLLRTKKMVKGQILQKVKGGYSVAIAGFMTFTRLSTFNKKQRKLGFKKIKDGFKKIKDGFKKKKQKIKDGFKKKKQRRVNRKMCFKLSLKKRKGRQYSLVLT